MLWCCLMPRMLIVLAALVILVLPLSTSSEDATNLDKYLNRLTDRKVDIVFVFDTSNSMGGEINELRAIANKFAADLEASHIDYNLGLVEFRDFPVTCGEGKKVQCGSPGDFVYAIKGNGTLTSEISTFNSWLEELEAGGGGSGGPEAILAALRHAGSDLLWREDTEKEIILLTDAGPHPDGSCCNAEGDTLEGTIFGLTHIGASVNVIGPDDASLKKIAGDTGGQFFRIRSGSSLKPLLEKITAGMNFSFKVEVEANCENRELDAKVKLIGKGVIPYFSGQTEVWMFIDQAANRSRYNLSYDQVAQEYQIKLPDVCGSIDLTVYGRVGERSSVQALVLDCEPCRDAVEGLESATLINNPPIIAELISNKTSPQNQDTVVTWTAEAFDSDGDIMLYRFFLDDRPITEWTTERSWLWTANETGLHRVEVHVRDSKHAGPNGLDDRKVETLTITEPKPTEPENLPPTINDLLAKQDQEMNIAWTANVTDPDSDKILTKYFLNGEAMTDWTTSIEWILSASDASVGDNKVEVQVRDGKHAGHDRYDDAKSVHFNLSSMKLMIQKWQKTYGGLGNDTLESFAQSLQQTSDGGYIIAGKTESYGAGGDDIWLIKTDPSGNKEWDRTFGGSDDEYPVSVQQTALSQCLVKNEFLRFHSFN